MGNARVESLLFKDDIARLASSHAGLQRAVDRFVAECTMAGMQISTKKIEVMALSRQKEQCAMNVNGTPLDQVEKFKYLGSNSRMTQDWTARLINALGQRVQFCARFIDQW